MYCRNCGNIIDENASGCENCGVLTAEPKRKFYKAGFVLGILSLCLPMWGLILGIIGLPMAIISKRKSAIIMNSIGIVAWVLIISLIFVPLLTNRTAITAEQFTEKATDAELTVTDLTEEFAGLFVVVLSATDGAESFRIEFVETENQSQAGSLFSQNRIYLETIGGIHTTVSGINWGRKTRTAGGEFFYVAYIDNTVVFAQAPGEYSDFIREFMRELGY